MSAGCKRQGCDRPVRSRNLCESDYRRALRKGMFGYRDATAVRGRVDALRAAGWTWAHIADATGLSPRVVYDVGERRYSTVLVETERAILRVPVVPRESHRGVDATGTRRRVQALMWLGWSTVALSERVGLKPASLYTMCHRSRGSVSVRTARRVSEVYNELSCTPGPCKQSRTKAVRHGYAPPAAWDDDTIDDPAAVADWGAPEPVRSCTKVDPENAQWLASFGMSVELIAEKYNAAPHTVRLALREAA